ncbi:FIG01209174: hypothetical protein [hydrothermal vent metagenome]|uniref:DUF3373 domain-containing protein n=1 Tax=hydrothermal vent metagenome TaxID=652676 RepID=A0A1W1BMN2_9ZZZZ
MKKTVITLSVLSAFALSANATSNAELQKELTDLKSLVAKLEKKITKTDKKAGQARTMANGNHLKWDVDFRTTLDNIEYTKADGTKSKNSSLFTNRLFLNLKYDAGDKVRFYGTLSFNKAFGQTLTNDSAAYSYFDWVTNENAHDTNLRVKEAYWLYANNTFLGQPISWTASIGRRPSVDGLGANFREGNKRKSAIASTVNVEFDGASFKWNLDKVTPLTGSWFKLCMGRGLTSAKPRFTRNGDDYAKDDNYINSNMIGAIFVPYDDGQYSLHTNYAKANHMIGFDQADLANPNATFKDVGDLDLATVMFKADGIGDGISDFLDDTIFFASYSQSKTHPKAGHTMLGSTESETGSSVLVGMQMPCPITDDGRFGIEFNKGSKYWRSMTYGEDTVIGSKIAARGTAKEVYWIKPVTKSLSMSLRYTQIDYDYTGSNAFFGAEGTPMTMAQAQANGMNPVEKAKDFRIVFRYKY